MMGLVWLFNMYNFGSELFVLDRVVFIILYREKNIYKVYVYIICT